MFFAFYLVQGGPIIETMPKKGNQDAELSKVPKTIYLSRDVVRRLEKAAESEGMSNSVYIEQTLRARFKRDGIE